MKSFDELFLELSNKVAAGNSESKSVAYIAQGAHTIGKKIVEEAAEVWMAAEHEGKARTAEEISQLLYHLQALMIAQGISLEEVYEQL